jgi:ABC-type lipoprotein release transport system permease subunit
MTIAAATAALLACGLVYTFIPARRAAHVDPVRAVAQE